MTPIKIRKPPACQQPEPADTGRVNIELLNTGSESMPGRGLNTHQQRGLFL